MKLIYGGLDTENGVLTIMVSKRREKRREFTCR